MERHAPEKVLIERLERRLASVGVAQLVFDTRGVYEKGGPNIVKA